MENKEAIELITQAIVDIQNSQKQLGGERLLPVAIATLEKAIKLLEL